MLRERFNSGVRYEGSAFKWDTVIEQKTLELGRYLTNRSNRLNFSEPAPNLGSPDDQGVRELILSLSQCDAKRRGIGSQRFIASRRERESWDRSESMVLFWRDCKDERDRERTR